MFYERVFFMVCFHEWNDSGCKMALIGSSKFAEKGMNWINCCIFYNNIYTQRIRIQMKGIVTNENITICLIANNWEQLKLRDFISCEWVDHELESTRLGEVVDSFPIFHLKIMIPLETPILERNKRSHWWNNDLVRASTSWSWARMKISVITDISVIRFYGYIGYIGDISVDIIGRLKIVKNSWKCKKNLIII